MDRLPMAHLRAGGVSLVVDLEPPGGDGPDGGARGLPVVLHWGPDLGDLPGDDLAALRRACAGPLVPSSPDSPVPLPLLPAAALGWSGTPGLEGHRADGTGWSPLLAVTAVRVRPGAAGDGGLVEVEAADAGAGLAVTCALELAASGLLRVRHAVENTGADAYWLRALRAVLPLPPWAGEVLDLTGRWCAERRPQRHPLRAGTWLREGRHGRTGHDATVGLMVGTAGFGFRSGEVWAAHVAFSGDHAAYAELLPTGARVLGGGELLAPGEVVLAPGERYAAPEVFAAYSGRGVDGITAAFHGWLRARPSHPRTPRPVVLNTWEAVYFRHDRGVLARLADAAAELGVERFVLDDGWFRHRRDDTAGLGDWYVDAQVWPDGLGPLVDHVTGLGMQFGLWVEPEMVNVDSDLYRAHPDWVLGVPGRLPPAWRNQQVLDLVEPAAFGYVLGRLDALLSEYAISFLKWDMNRDLVEAGHAGRPAVHAQTLAVYRLLDELRRRHPGVEVESCASGGARVDLGILGRTDRVWTSDCNDALERQSIQRWTGVFLPPELVGAHVGPPASHTTGRVHSLAFRCATALFGHAGIEWDVTAASAAERGLLRSWIRLYKQERGLLHTGTVVRADVADPAAALHGVVAGDGSRALFAYVQLAAPAAATPGRMALPGLDDAVRYRVEPVPDLGGPAGLGRRPPGWSDGVVLPGRVLGRAGLEMPSLWPEQALLLRATAVG